MRYSAERKEAILKKMAPPMSMTIPELAEQEGITATTLYNWRKQARARGQVLPSRSNEPDQWTSQEKFQIVLETAPMNEAELSAYCRERGLYPEQVEAWRDACMNANDDAAAQAKQLRQTRKAEQKRLRKLERELHRKDKALAETAALLALSKKAEAIWGTTNDEDDVSDPLTPATQAPPGPVRSLSTARAVACRGRHH